MLVRNVGNYQSVRRNIAKDLDLFEGCCEDDSDSSTLKMGVVILVRNVVNYQSARRNIAEDLREGCCEDVRLRLIFLLSFCFLHCFPVTFCPVHRHSHSEACPPSPRLISLPPTTPSSVNSLQRV